MMDVPYRSFLSSKPFRIIGPNGTKFYIHGQLLTECSNVLAVAVNGQMKEAESKIIRIEAVDEDLDDDTVMRFIEYAYRGDYTVPPPDVVLAAKDIEHEDVREISPDIPDEPVLDEPEAELIPEEAAEPIPEPIAEEVAWGFRAKKDKKQKKKSNLWFDDAPLAEESLPPPAAAPEERPSTASIKFISKDTLWTKFCARAVVRQPAPGWEPAGNASDACEDYSQVLLSHARLYVFSDRYECNGLRDLSLQKLRLTLSRFTLHQSRLADIVDLARYTYAHTAEHEFGRDKLRTLVIDYMACVIERFLRRRDLTELVRKNGDFAVDLMETMGERLC